MILNCLRALTSIRPIQEGRANGRDRVGRFPAVVHEDERVVGDGEDMYGEDEEEEQHAECLDCSRPRLRRLPARLRRRRSAICRRGRRKGVHRQSYFLSLVGIPTRSVINMCNEEPFPKCGILEVA